MRRWFKSSYLLACIPTASDDRNATNLKDCYLSAKLAQNSQHLGLHFISINRAHGGRLLVEVFGCTFREFAGPYFGVGVCGETIRPRRDAWHHRGASEL